MEIIILLTLLLFICWLGRALFRAAELCLIGKEQTDRGNGLFRGAEKLVMRNHCLLNTVALSNAQKATQTTLIQLQNLKFEG
ncbi:hypothetical protein [Falsiporphyromonas endometrii]|uniref:ATP synthase F0 subunit 8 n=1 Tax=Falsiporphyromonas endometrii TaxID=1387297 RepID=A0ABV9K9D2_9PORP